MEVFPEITCPDCGAPMKNDLTCQEMFDELLAREFSDPACGAVHHLTVLCYNLQHPGAFSEESIQWSISALTAAVKQKWTAEDILSDNRRNLSGKKVPILRKDNLPVDSLRDHWTMTVANVYSVSPKGHAERVKKWATAIIEDLEESMG